MKGRIFHFDDVVYIGEPSVPAGPWTSATDVTEAVQVLYDLVISSMNFGSGFWGYEELKPVAELAKRCEFENAQIVLDELEAQKPYWETAHFLEKYPEARQERFESWPEDKKFLPGEGQVVHEHIFNSAGRCIWPQCNETGEPDPRMKTL